MWAYSAQWTFSQSAVGKALQRIAAVSGSGTYVRVRVSRYAVRRRLATCVFARRTLPAGLETCWLKTGFTPTRYPNYWHADFLRLCARVPLCRVNLLSRKSWETQMKNLIFLSLLLVLAACNVDHEDAAAHANTAAKAPALPTGFTLVAKPMGSNHSCRHRPLEIYHHGYARNWYFPGMFYFLPHPPVPQQNLL